MRLLIVKLHSKPVDNSWYARGNPIGDLPSTTQSYAVPKN
jgi:hypothetical protein